VPKDNAPKWLILFLIWLMMLVAYMDRVNISVAGPSIIADLHLTKTQFGIVLSSFSLGYALMQIPGGWLADRFGSRGLLIGALLMWSLFTGLTGAASGLFILIAIRILFGVGEGVENGAQFKLIGDAFTPTERSRASGIFLTAVAIGPAFATPLAAGLVKSIGWRTTFLCFASLGIVVAAVLFFLLPNVAKPLSRPVVKDPNVGSVMRQGKTWRVVAAYLLFNVAFWGFIGWMPTYLREQRHISLSELGFVGMLPYLAGFLGLLAAGHLGTTRLAHRREAIVAFSYAAAAIFVFLVINAASTATCIAFLSLAAFFLFGAFGPFWGVALDIPAAWARGTFSGFVNFGGQLGAIAGQIVIGLLADRLKSFDGALMLMSGSLVVGAVVMAVGA
jgi:sugar phosphate permease